MYFRQDMIENAYRDKSRNTAQLGETVLLSYSLSRADAVLRNITSILIKAHNARLRAFAETQEIVCLILRLSRA